MYKKIFGMVVIVGVLIAGATYLIPAEAQPTLLAGNQYQTLVSTQPSKPEKILESNSAVTPIAQATTTVKNVVKQTTAALPKLFTSNSQAPAVATAPTIVATPEQEETSEFSVNLIKGWNLISLQFIPTETSGSATLWHGDSLASSNPSLHLTYWEWQTKTNLPWFIYYNKLQSPFAGAWIKSDDSYTLKIKGIPQTVPTGFFVKKGWNLVGFGNSTDLPLSSLKFTRGVRTKTYSQIYDEGWMGGWIEGMLQGWIKENRSVYTLGPDEPNYYDSSIIKSGEGYWLMSYSEQPIYVIANNGFGSPSTIEVPNGPEMAVPPLQ